MRYKNEEIREEDKDKYPAGWYAGHRHHTSEKVRLIDLDKFRSLPEVRQAVKELAGVDIGERGFIAASMLLGV